MPTPVAECRVNANFVQAGQGAWPLPTRLNGRLTGLPVYDLEYDHLIQRVTNLATVITGIGTNDTGRRTDHADQLGNLPFAPTQGHPVAEYHVAANGLPHPAHLRVVYDSYRRIVYLTPCHYDPWTDAGGANRNPFYVVVNAPLPSKLKFARFAA